MFLKRYAVFAAAGIACALALAACGGSSSTDTTPPPSGSTTTAPPPASGSSVTASIQAADLTGDKALYAAESAYKGYLVSVDAAHNAGLTKGAVAVTLKSYSDQAWTAILNAKKAKAAADTVAETAAALSALSLIGQGSGSVPLPS